MKLVSFSLWGAAPKYTVGALRNAELCPLVYPGFTARFPLPPVSYSAAGR